MREERDKAATAASKAIRYSYDLLDRMVKADYTELVSGQADEPIALSYQYWIEYTK